MICLNEQHIKAAIGATKNIIKENTGISFPELAKKLYNRFYQPLIEKNDREKVENFSIEIVKYIAKEMHSRIDEFEQENQLIDAYSKVQDALNEEQKQVLKEQVVNKIKLNPQDMLNLQRDEAIRELVGLNRRKEIKRPIIKDTSVKIQNALLKIKNLFPQSVNLYTFYAKAIESTIKGIPDKETGTLIKLSGQQSVDRGEYFDIEPLFRASQIATGHQPKDYTEPYNLTESTEYGNIVDNTIRFFIKNKDKSYAQLKKQLQNDPDFRLSFSQYMTLQRSNSPEVRERKIFEDYLDSFLDDMIYVINQIEETYKDYYLTDLTELGSDSKNFRIYDISLNAIGALDLVAIKEDGSYRVIDIKTAYDKISLKKKEDYNTQISIYNLILSNIEGLTPENKSDIFYIQKDIYVTDRSDTDKFGKFVKSVLKSTEVVSLDSKTKEEVLEKIVKYKEEFYKSYNPKTDLKFIEEDNLDEKKAKSKKSNLSVTSRIRYKNNFRKFEEEKNKKPLLSKIVKNEKMSTTTSLKEGVKWLKNTFPEISEQGVHVVKTLLSDTGGQFFLDAIYLAEKSNEGVAYHEGWHRFTQLYLKKDEKVTLYNKTKERAIDFISREGVKLNTSTATFMEIEEFLADEFTKYANNPSEYKFDKLGEEPKSIFQKIWEFVLSLFNFKKNNGENSYQKLFNNLYFGTFYRGNFSMNNAMFSSLRSVLKDNTGNTLIDNTTFIRFRNYLDNAIQNHAMDNSYLINDRLIKSVTSFKDIISLIQESLVNLKDSYLQMEEDGVITPFQKTQLENLQKILEPKNINKFVASYLKFTGFKSIKNFYEKNINLVNKEKEESENSNIEKEESEGTDIPNSRLEEGPEIEFDRSGETDAFALARAELKDWFNSVSKLNVDKQGVYIIPEIDGVKKAYDEFYEVDDFGFVKTLEGKKAFYKTLEILSGSPSISILKQKLTNPDNYYLFPELQIIKDRLLGAKYDVDGTIYEVEGLIPKMERLSEAMNAGTISDEEAAEHSSLLSFMMHFLQIMGMSKVELLTLKVDFSKANEGEWDEQGGKKTFNPSSLIENTDISISNLINQLASEFQTNAKIDDDKTISIYEALQKLKSDGNLQSVNLTTAAKSLSSYKFFKNELGDYFFNPFYKLENFEYFYTKESFSLSQKAKLQDFYSSFGVSLENALLNNPAYRYKILQNYKSLIGIRNELANTSLNVFKSNLYWKEKELTNPSDNKEALQTIINKMFSKNPIDRLMYLGQEYKEKKGDRSKIFAKNLPTLIELASLKREMKDNYSSGSVLTKSGSQFSYYQPNQQLIIADFINSDEIQSFKDFDKYEALYHLNPIRNRQLLYEPWIRMIFDDKGNKIPSMKLKISVLTQQTINSEIGEKIEKTTGELSIGSKILFDFMVVSDTGYSEIKRMETSDSSWRQSVFNENTGKDVPILKNIESFKDGQFLTIIHHYITSAAFMYRFHKSKEGTGYLEKPINNLGVFEEMLGKDITDEIKSFVNSKPLDYDLNNMLGELLMLNEEFIEEIEKKVVSYFEDITFGNQFGIDSLGEDSFSKFFKDNISEEDFSKVSKLIKYSQVYNGKFPFKTLKTPGNISELFSDKKFKEKITQFVATDFLNSMADSAMFFGDYTYWKDAIKRRKVIGNNGSIHTVTGELLNAVNAQLNFKSIKKTYRDFYKMEPSTKPNSVVRKTVLIDEVVSLDYENKVIKPLEELYKQLGIKSDPRVDKVATIKAWGKAELGDAAAYISLDLYRFMRQRERLWSEQDEAEYNRQNLILDWHLFKNPTAQYDEDGNFIEEDFTEDEFREIFGKPYSSFNVAKFAMTGPILSQDIDSHLMPVFDKMGLKVLIPETDYEQRKTLFDYMYTNDADYLVYESGSKGFIAAKSEAWGENGLDINAKYVDHAGSFFKNQQNTTSIKKESVLANQLRGIFYSPMLLHANLRPVLEQQYKRFINSLTEIIDIKSGKTLASIGLNRDGNFIEINGKVAGKKIFVEKIREKVIDLYPSQVEILDTLDVDKDGNFINFLESLHNYKDIYNIISGLMDDSFRKIKLNGSKFYQTIELGTSLQFNNSKRNTDKSLKLNWHKLDYTPSGKKIVGTLECECKISFSKAFEPLLNLPDRDGIPIKVARRTFKEQLDLLNALRSDEIWYEQYKESFVMVGVRIPLQDLNFVSHLTVREFLSPVEGDVIILPTEFYKQVGADNDIDTVTATYKFLDEATGLPIAKVNESYKDIQDKLLKIEDDISSIAPTKTVEVTSKIDMEYLLRNYLEIYENNGKTEEDFIKDLTLHEAGGVNGQYDKKSFFYKIKRMNLGSIGKQTYEQHVYEDFLEDVDNLVQQTEFTETYEEDVDESSEYKRLKKERRDLKKKQRNYIKGLTNEVVDSIITVLRTPEAFLYFTETDDMSKVENMSKKIIELKTEKNIKDIDATFNAPMSALKSIGAKNNYVNHNNNFGVRTQLGSWVKFARLLVTLKTINAGVNKKYKSASDAKTLLGDKFLYDRTIRNPLSKENDKSFYSFEMYDEKGERINKNVSIIVSTLLDLFKNPDTYPSLNVTWNNIKQAIFLSSLRIPMEDIMLYLNNPITEELEITKNKLGESFQMRHSIVETGKNLFDSEIFDKNESSFFTYADNVKGAGMNRFTTGQFQRAEEKLTQLEITEGSLKFTIDEINEFTRIYNRYKREESKKGNPIDLKSFLKNNPSYKKLAKNIFLYHITLIEDGNNFYKSVVKYLDRDSVKYNNEGKIYDIKAREKIITKQGMLNDSFLEDIRNDSVFSFLYHDETVLNGLSVLKQEILQNPTIKQKYNELLAKLISEVNLDSEGMKKFSQVYYTDFLEMIYKNFFVLELNQKDINGVEKLNKNFLFDFFKSDIFVDFPKLKKEFSLSNAEEIMKQMEMEEEDSLFSFEKLPNQLPQFLSKYPEFRELEIFKILGPRTLSSHLNQERMNQFRDNNNEELDETGEPLERSDEEYEERKYVKKLPDPNLSELINTMKKSYIFANFSKDAQKREVEELVVRNQFEDLLNFDISKFEFLNIESNRINHYMNGENIKEIQEFMNVIAFYSFMIAPHIDKSRGNFSSIIPISITKRIIENAINNFNKYNKTWTTSNYTIFFEQFEEMFREMNSEFKLQTKDKGEYYFHGDAGKLYGILNKFSVNDPFYQTRLAMLNPSKEGVNTFLIKLKDRKPYIEKENPEITLNIKASGLPSSDIIC